jgi:hypothetical protein
MIATTANDIPTTTANDIPTGWKYSLFELLLLLPHSTIHCCYADDPLLDSLFLFGISISIFFLILT